MGETGREGGVWASVWGGGTRGAAGSVRWLSHLDTWGYLLGCAHEAQEAANFLLGMDAATHACVHRHEGAGLSLAAACETAQAPGGRRASGGLWLIHGSLGWAVCTPQATRRAAPRGWSGRSQKKQGLAPSVLQTRPSWPEALAFSPGEEPRKGCLPRCCCAAVKAACTEQVWDVLPSCQHARFQSEKVSTAFGKKKAVVCLLCVMKYRTHRYPRTLHGEVHCLQESCPAALGWR